MSAKEKALDIYVQWTEPVLGTVILVAFERSWPFPIGFVWGVPYGPNDSGKKGFDVCGSHIEEDYRRQGVRTAIQRTLFEKFDRDFVQTSSGTKDGRAWMKSAGYRLNRQTGIRTCTRRQFYAALARRSTDLLQVEEGGRP